MTSPLTRKRRRFCEEYVVDLNATAAAKRAGYSERTAEVQGCRLLKNVQVASYVAKLQADAAKRNEVSVDKVIGMLAASYTDAKAANQHGPAVRAAELLGRMVKDGLQIHEFHKEQRNLEDAFIDMLGRIDRGETAMEETPLPSEPAFTPSSPTT